MYMRHMQLGAAMPQERVVSLSVELISTLAMMVVLFHWLGYLGGPKTTVVIRCHSWVLYIRKVCESLWTIRNNKTSDPRNDSCSCVPVFWKAKGLTLAINVFIGVQTTRRSIYTIILRWFFEDFEFLLWNLGHDVGHFLCSRRK